MTSCGCYPNYIDALSIIMDQIYRDEKSNQLVNESRKRFLWKSIRSSFFDLEKSTRPCSFIEHAVCVSTIMDQFRIPKSKCLPACISHTFSPRVSQNFIMISVLVRNPCQAKIHSVCQNKSEKSSTHATGSEPDKWHRHNITCHQTCRATKLKHQRNCLVFKGENHKKSNLNLPFTRSSFWLMSAVQLDSFLGWMFYKLWLLWLESSSGSCDFVVWRTVNLVRPVSINSIEKNEEYIQRNLPSYECTTELSRVQFQVLHSLSIITKIHCKTVHSGQNKASL